LFCCLVLFFVCFFFFCFLHHCFVVESTVKLVGCGFERILLIFLDFFLISFIFFFWNNMGCLGMCCCFFFLFLSSFPYLFWVVFCFLVSFLCVVFLLIFLWVVLSGVVWDVFVLLRCFVFGLYVLSLFCFYQGVCSLFRATCSLVLCFLRF